MTWITNALVPVFAAPCMVAIGLYLCAKYWYLRLSHWRRAGGRLGMCKESSALALLVNPVWICAITTAVLVLAFAILMFRTKPQRDETLKRLEEAVGHHERCSKELVTLSRMMHIVSVERVQRGRRAT